MHHPIRNQRTDQGSLDPGSVHQICMSCCLVHPASEFTSEDAAEQHHVGFHRHHRLCVAPVGWTASSWAFCPLEVQRTSALVRQGQASAAGMLGIPVGGPRRAAVRFGCCLRTPTPCGATRHSRWPPYRRGPLGRSRREATPIWRLRSPGLMAVPRPGVIVSASGADDFPCRPGGGSQGSRCRELRPKGTPI